MTAEGVEAERLAMTLAKLGCDTLQGFFFSRPEPADVLLERLQKQTNRPVRNLRA